MKFIKNNVRNYSYDLIRTLSCICVILIHTTGSFLDYPKDTNLFLVGDFLQGIVRIGLPMFVVLSGALILNSEEEKISKFYFKRYVKIIIPFIIYYFIYIFMDNNYSFSVFNPRHLLHWLKIMAVESNRHVHFWYIYMIIGIYMCAPFLKKMCKSLNDKDIANLFFLICIINIIKEFLPYIGIYIGITNITFYGWVSYFLLGYIFTNCNLLLKHYKLFYLLGIISFIFTILDVRYEILGIKSIYTYSITMMFMVIAVFVFFRNININFNTLSKKVLAFTSKYSWGVYLVHSIIIYILFELKDKYQILIINKAFTTILINILVVFISFITAFIIENLLIKYVQKLAYKVDNITFKFLSS